MTVGETVMAKLFKWIASIIGILIGVGILLVVGIITLVNPNDFKDEISQQVYNRTGRHLTLAGDIHWSVYPGLGLQLNNASLSNPKGFDDQPFAQVAQATIEVKLLPLLQRNLEVKKLDLDGLTINLVKNAQGEGNWKSLGGEDEASASSPNEVSDPPTHNSFTFNIAAIAVTHSKITWTDPLKNQQLVLNNLNLHSNNIATQQSFPVDLQCTVQSNKPSLNGNIQAVANVEMDQAQKIYKISQLHFKSALTGDSLPNHQLNLNLLGNISADTEQKKYQGQIQTDQLQIGQTQLNNIVLPFSSDHNIIELNPIQAQLYQGDTNGNIRINLQQKIPQISANLQLKNIQTAQLTQALTHNKLQIDGTGNFSTVLKTRGNDASSFSKNLNGQGQLDIRNGTLYGIDIPFWVNLTKSVLPNFAVPSVLNQKNIAFNAITGSFTVANGVIQNKNLLLNSPALQVTGLGLIDLTKQQIDYRALAQIKDTSTGQLKDPAIPFQIKGSLANPSIQPDVSNIVSSKLKEQYLKHKEEIGNKLNNVLGKDLGNQIQNTLQSFFH